MGTRSNTVVRERYAPEGEWRTILNLYRQMDGYPSGHGAELAEFLNGLKIVNGLGLDEKRRVANGPGCLAAQIVAHFKTGAGGFYLEPGPADLKELDNDYAYVIDVESTGGGMLKWGAPRVTVLSLGKAVRDAVNLTVPQFVSWVNKQK